MMLLMPDWFYRTCARPALFCLPDPAGRAIALGVIGTLGRSKAGRALIEFMGHMSPASSLRVSIDGVEFASPVGLGWRVDPEQLATHGLSCFGGGCIEIQQGGSRGVSRHGGDALDDGDTVNTLAVSKRETGPTPLLVRSRNERGDEVVRLPSGLSLPVVAWNESVPDGEFGGKKGIVLQVGTRLPNGGWRVPAAMPGSLPEKLGEWRRRLPRGVPIIVAGGVGCPSDAKALVEAGADLILIDAGLVFGGPGLVKRCNEGLVQRVNCAKETTRDRSLFRMAWFWGATLGAALIFGGVLALLLSMSRVLLPYDEHFLGFSVDTLRRNSPRLFSFMAHDRATLAGVMLGLGWLYWMLARNAVRKGRHGAATALIASALTGFASFFGFFGFGYFDTLHAFVAAVLFQITVQIMVGVNDVSDDGLRRPDVEDFAWRRAQWGQLLWVLHAIGLLVAGAVILGIGMTAVFVSEDLSFLCITKQQAQELGARVMGVVAHDRATLGGMLLASGVAMLLPVLWCFRRGEQWLWTAIAGLGLPAYGAALGIHIRVGYLDWRHMVPAVAGLMLWVGGLSLTASYLRSHLEGGEGPARSWWRARQPLHRSRGL